MEEFTGEQKAVLLVGVGRREGEGEGETGGGWLTCIASRMPNTMSDTKFACILTVRPPVVRSLPTAAQNLTLKRIQVRLGAATEFHLMRYFEKFPLRLKMTNAMSMHCFWVSEEPAAVARSVNF